MGHHSVRHVDVGERMTTSKSIVLYTFTGGRFSHVGVPKITNQSQTIVPKITNQSQTRVPKITNQSQTRVTKRVKKIRANKGYFLPIF